MWPIFLATAKREAGHALPGEEVCLACRQVRPRLLGSVLHVFLGVEADREHVLQDALQHVREFLRWELGSH